jgi:digeranylgeranylglycerophospholipid reductase
VQLFGLDLTGEYEVNAGTLPSIAYDPELVFGSVIRVGDSANFATPTVGEGIRICMDHGEALGRALGETIRANDPVPLKTYEADCKKALAHNYHFDFLANKRFSLYSAKDWNKSILLISHLS